MRCTHVLVLASTCVAFAFGTPTMASKDPARTSLPALASPGCSVGGSATARGRATDDDLSKDWDPHRREAFGRLLVAAERFAGAVALHETDHSQTDHSQTDHSQTDHSLALGDCDIPTAQAVERHVFRRTLEALVADADPRMPPMTAREADGALDAAYAEVMAVDDPRNLAWGSVDKGGIRQAERAWLAYRDAFVAFAATFETPGAAERLRIELTMRRATSLEAFLAD